MIIFDGIALETIAPVKIDDIMVGAVELEPTVRPYVEFGGYFVRNRRGTRTIVITFALLEQDRNRRELYLKTISEWAKSDKEYRLQLPHYDDMYLSAVCTGKPEGSYRQWWQPDLRLTFTCISDPCWISSTVKTAPCGEDFIVAGGDIPLMWIERTLTSAATNQSYTLDGRTMTFSSIPSGNLVISLNNQTAKVDGTSIMANYAVSSNFLIARRGTLKITGTGSVKWRERWQ